MDLINKTLPPPGPGENRARGTMNDGIEVAVGKKFIEMAQDWTEEGLLIINS